MERWVGARMSSLVSRSPSFAPYIIINVATIITGSCYRVDRGQPLLSFPPPSCPVITVISTLARLHIVANNQPLASIIFLLIPSELLPLPLAPLLPLPRAPSERSQPLSLPQSLNPRHHHHHYHYGHYHHRSANGLVTTKRNRRDNCKHRNKQPGLVRSHRVRRRRRRHMASQKRSSNGASEGGQRT